MAPATSPPAFRRAAGRAARQGREAAAHGPMACPGPPAGWGSGAPRGGPPASPSSSWSAEFEAQLSAEGGPASASGAGLRPPPAKMSGGWKMTRGGWNAAGWGSCGALGPTGGAAGEPRAGGAAPNPRARAPAGGPAPSDAPPRGAEPPPPTRPPASG